MQGYICIRFFMEILAAEVRRMVLKKKSGGSEGIAYILLRFSLPLILSGVLQQLYNWADAFIVGNVVGELALAAVGATTTVINFYLMAVTGFTLGLSILFAQKYGSGETEHIPEILSTFSIVFGGVFIILSALGIAAAFPLLGLLHTTRDTVLLAGSYLKIIFAGIPFLAVYNVYAAALRGIGDSRAPFLAILFSSAINVGLDILFVAFLHWGGGGSGGSLCSLTGGHGRISDHLCGEKISLTPLSSGKTGDMQKSAEAGRPFRTAAHDTVQRQCFWKPAAAEFHEWFWHADRGGCHHGVSGGFHHIASDHQPGLRDFYDDCPEPWWRRRQKGQENIRSRYGYDDRGIAAVNAADYSDGRTFNCAFWRRSGGG